MCLPNKLTGNLMEDVLNDQVTRRSLLQAAGGITFFALAGGASAVTPKPGTQKPVEGPKAFGKGPLPVFTALPYLQAAPDATLLRDGEESIVVAWQTDRTPAEYAVTCDGRHAEVSTVLAPGKGSRLEGRANHAALITGLKLGRRYDYRVTMNGGRLLDGYFTTRKPRGATIRFVSFGDNSFGDISDRAIAYEAYRARPDFVMNTGDLVYESGINDEFGRYFFPVYNADEAGPRIGAPLLRSIPLYTVIANHDLSGKTPDGPGGDFAKFPDSLGYYTNMHLPCNGHAPTHPTPIAGPESRLEGFRKAAGRRFPTQANYSFDYGDIHFLCLDSNVYVDTTDAELQAWIARDLEATDAPWKFVVYHHPAFNVGHEHYEAQQMRALTPIFEQHGVQIVLSGHEHTYQRTRPLTFVPSDLSLAKDTGAKSRLVPGAFTVDRAFDGQRATRPKGIIYITTGAGGRYLYDPDQNGAPSSWLHEEDSNADYVAQMITDRHSLTVFNVENRTLSMRQIDEWGNEVDRIRVDRV